MLPSCPVAWRSFASYVPLALLLLTVMNSSRSLRAQSFNPNGFDAVRTMNEVLHPQSDLVLVSSHRGLHALVNGNDAKVPENSLQAIGLSAQAGNEEIELDVKLTSDGVPILSHDQTWGREWCGITPVSLIYGQANFNPFVPPGTNNNDAANPVVTATSLADTKSFFGFTVLRDSVSLAAGGTNQDPYNRGCTTYGKYYGQYPPTLQDALNYMTENKIAMVLALDIRDPATATAAWQVVAQTPDYLGRSYALSTLFKIPAKAFSSPADVENTFKASPGSKAAYFQPVYNTSDIEATSATTSSSLLTFGGTDVDPSTTGYGSEAAINQSLNAFENDPNLTVAAVEIQIHQNNGILSSVLAHAKTNQRTGGRESVTVFSPYVDYWASDDPNHTVPLFFTTTAICCIPITNFFYNPTQIPDPSQPISPTLGGQPAKVTNPNYDSSRPSDTAEQRTDPAFLEQQGFNSITYDNPADLISRLANDGYRAGFSRIKGNPPAGRATFSTCDIYSTGGTPCVAAHSTVRALSNTYNGNLYQVQRASDNTTADIAVVTSTGYANAAAQDSFCANTSCVITKIYDQSIYHNDLTIEGPGGNGGQDSGAVANALPITLNGTKVYGVSVTQGVGYRNNNTTAVARNVGNNQVGAPEGTYMVTSGTNVNRGCCFDYGNAETSSDDTGNGHMDALNFGTFCEFTCSGSGPWVEADLENGQYQGNGTNTNDQSISSNFVTAMLKNNSQTAFGLKAGNAQSGGLTTEYSGSLPTTKAGYTPMSLEGAIVLGTGGDNSNSGVGSFFEGAMTAGTPSDATDDAVQANIVAAGYGGSSNPTDGEASTYTGPSDPNGPGPQDGFATGGVEQANDLMGTKPAMAFFNQKIFAAFQANDASHTLFVTSTMNGQPYPSAVPAPDVQIGSAPAMVVYRHQLYIGFQADNSSHHLFITSSPDGSNFPHATGYPNIAIGSAPGMVEWRHQLLVAFQADDSSHVLFVTASPDGTNFPAATAVPNVQIGSAPALAVFRNTLYVAFRADDSSNDLWVASSADGVTFTSKRIAGFTNAQTTGPNSSPALVVSNGVLYCIYGADDLGNEMLVMATTDGVTWQGPKAYLGVQMGASGPGATATGVGLTVGFQSNDARNVLYTTYKTTQALAYTGPSDPTGSGPQDDFSSPAKESSAVKMGSKPALVTNAPTGTVFAAFQANDAGHLLYVTSAPVGSTFPGVYGQAADAIGSAPGAAIFNGKLYVGFQADNSSDHLFITSSPDGTNFPHATGYPNLQIGSAPAMAVFNGKLYVAFQADDSSHFLYVTSSTDGSTFPTAKGYGDIAIGSAPAMAVFNGSLYIAFRADDTSNDVWIASSSDGVNFSSRRIAGPDNPQQMGWQSSPTLVVSGGNLYCAWGANDLANELIVMASSDGSSWQGPRAYPDIKMGDTGPGGGSITGTGGVPLAALLGFQSDDTANILFTTQTQ